jgi:hypothetical protein
MHQGVSSQHPPHERDQDDDWCLSNDREGHSHDSPTTKRLLNRHMTRRLWIDHGYAAFFLLATCGIPTFNQRCTASLV